MTTHQQQHNQTGRQAGVGEYRRFADPDDLICPGCGEQVRPEPPGFWKVSWGLPAPGFSHQDATALCPSPITGRPAEPIEVEGWDR